MNTIITFGLILLVLGGGLIYSGIFYKGRAHAFIGALAIGLGIIFILVPYRTYRDFYVKYTTPTDNTFYYIGAEIVDQSIAGTTVFETENGDKYAFDTNPEWDWDCIYLLTMDDNATPYDKTDDSICVVWSEVSKIY